MSNVLNLVYSAPVTHDTWHDKGEIGQWYRLESVYNCECDNKTKGHQVKEKAYVPGNYTALPTTI